MNELEMLDYEIRVIGPKKPEVTNPSEESIAQGIKKDLYYRVQLVPRKVTENGVVITKGAGIGKIRDEFFFKRTHTTHFNDIEEMLQTEGAFKTLTKKELDEKGETKESEMQVIDPKFLAFRGRWVTEPVYKKGVVDAAGQPVLQPYFVYGKDPVTGKFGKLMTRRKNPETGDYKGTKPEAMVLQEITYLVFDGESQITARMRAMKRIQEGIDAYNREVEKATPKPNATPEEVHDTNEPA